MMRFFLYIFLACLLAVPAVAQQTPLNTTLKTIDLPKRTATDEDAIITIAYENDIFVGNDNNYSNGLRVSYISPESKPWETLSRLANAVPFFPANTHTRWSFALGQNIYTPDNISLPNPPVNDQPYAGWLYGSAGIIADTEKTLDTFQITAGMVGPASGARQTQKFIHTLIDSPKPQGWDYQLHSEPGLVLTYQRKWRNLYASDPLGFDFDLSPSIGANVGNVFTDAGVGLVARFGQDLPSDYGPPLIRPSLAGSDFFIPSSDFGWYFFAGLDGTGVARNIFLDGNTFRDSRSVDKNILVGGAQAGVAITFRSMRLAYTQVFRTEEFKTQRDANQYGAVTASFRF